MARNGRRLGFLPGWRIFTYIILLFNIAMLIWIISAASTGNDKKDCNGLSASDCKNAHEAGAGIAIVLIIVIWALVDVILGVLWLITNRHKRQCPACGRDVKKGQMQCRSCGHDFRVAAQPQYAPQQQLPPASWMPDPQQPGMLRWWDGQRYTEHTQSTQR